ncbi:MAG TPA: amidase [Acidimicrobiia bacterium]|nr:amidase [Acidimicrobiia bacterium]
MPELWERDASVLADEIRAGALKSRELLDVCLDRIERHDAALKAVCYLDVDGARRSAEEIDRRVADGEDPGPFAGVPALVKETHAVTGMPYTGASLIYADRVADHDEECIARMRAAGAVIAGLATAPEFGSLNYTRTKLHGVTGNPWNPECTPGGSSGGSAAVVAGGLVPIASGGDGGGSIRIPSSFSGLFGFKGSQGRVPEGPISFDGSLTTQYGAMTRSVRDAARALDVMSGPNPTDPTSLPKPSRSFEEIATAPDPSALLRGRRAVWSSTFGYAVCDPEVEAITQEAAVALCEAAGMELVDSPVELPRVGATWGLLSSLEMVAWQGEAAAGRWDELTPAVRGGFELVENLRPEDIVRALRRRWQVIEAWGRVFAEVDVVLSPTTAVPAFGASGPPPREIAGREVGWTGATPYTMPANVAGTPAASIPVGFVGGLPVGLQVCARRHEDELCMAAGAVLERDRPWPKLAPLL